MKRRVLDYDLEIPQMQIIGEYELSGNLFFFPVGGKGNFAVNLRKSAAFAFLRRCFVFTYFPTSKALRGSSFQSWQTFLFMINVHIFQEIKLN